MRNSLKAETIYVLAGLIIVLLVLVLTAFLLKNKLQSFYKNKTARLMLFAILFSFVSLIPFLGLGNITERYTYLASVGFAILLIIILDKVSALVRNNNYKLILITVVMLIISSWYLYQNNIESAAWHEAGRVTNRTLGYIRLYCDGKHPNSGFYFVNLPIKIGQAWMFPVGLQDGMWFIYRDDSIKAYKLNSLTSGEAIPAKNADKSANFVFAFDKYRNIYELK